MPVLHRRISSLLGPAISIVFALTFALYWHIYVNTVKIANASSSVLQNVDIDLAGSPQFSGTLAPGQSRIFHGEPKGDGTLSVSFDFAGRHMQRRFGYVTPGLSDDHNVTIRSAADISYEMQSR